MVISDNRQPPHSSFVVALDPDEADQLPAELAALRDRWVELGGPCDRRAGKDGRHGHMVVAMAREVDD